MAKKTKPIITHTEILARAMRSIAGEIQEWHGKCAAFPEEQREKMFAAATEELRAKMEALKTLYCIETGTELGDYDDPC